MNGQAERLVLGGRCAEAGTRMRLKIVFCHISQGIVSIGSRRRARKWIRKGSAS